MRLPDRFNCTSGCVFDPAHKDTYIDYDYRILFMWRQKVSTTWFHHYNARFHSDLCAVCETHSEIMQPQALLNRLRVFGLLGTIYKRTLNDMRILC